MLPILRDEFSLGRRKGLNAYTTVSQLRQIKYLVSEYRAYEVIHLHMIDLFGFVILPLYSLIGEYILVVNFYVIGYSEWTFMALSVYAQILWGLFLDCCGKYYNSSRDTLESWKYSSEGETTACMKYMDKFRKSCRPMYIQSDGYFKIRSLTVLQFFRGIISGTLRALLAFKTFRTSFVYN